MCVVEKWQGLATSKNQGNLVWLAGQERVFGTKWEPEQQRGEKFISRPRWVHIVNVEVHDIGEKDVEKKSAKFEINLAWLTGPKRIILVQKELF